MISLVRRLAILPVLCVLAVTSYGQIDWKGAPSASVGDEDDEVPGQNVIVTGTVRSATTSEPVTGASISVDLFKFFDYTDNQGKYVLELPPGNYKLMVLHV